MLQVAALQVTRTQVHPPQVRRGGAGCVQVCTTCHHTCVGVCVLPAAAAAAHASAPTRFSPPARAPARGAPIRLALADAGPPLVLAVCAVADGAGRGACAQAGSGRSSRVQCGVDWCGVMWCGLVWCSVVWAGVVWCGAVRLAGGRCKRGDASTAQHADAQQQLVLLTPPLPPPPPSSVHTTTPRCSHAACTDA